MILLMGAGVGREKMAVKHTYLFKDGTKTKNLTPISAIREKCLECSCWSFDDVRECPAKDCALFPYRLGKRPR